MSKRPRNDPASSSGSDTAAPKKTRTIPPPPEPIPGPQANLTRILSWNVETPVPFLQLPPRKVGTSVAPGTRLSLLRDLLIRHDFPDFVCLQEVRARQTDKAWISALHNAANYHRKGGPKYSMYTALNQAKTGQRHFGVVTYVKDRERVAIAREVDWDAEGRVLILEMKSGWALVNVYALNGSEYIWRDLTLKSAPKTRNERKREFNRLLLQECRAMQERGLRLVLIGDFNISLTKRDCVPRLRTEYPHSLARKEFNDEFIPGLDLVDVYRALHGERPAFSWFAKGKPQGADCARVDYALVERSLMDSVVDSTYFEDSTERGHSDHAPFILTLQDLHVLKAAPDPSILHLSAEPTSSNG